jgi:hypothetical protein
MRKHSDKVNHHDNPLNCDKRILSPSKANNQPAQITEKRYIYIQRVIID